MQNGTCFQLVPEGWLSSKKLFPQYHQWVQGLLKKGWSEGWISCVSGKKIEIATCQGEFFLRATEENLTDFYEKILILIAFSGRNEEIACEFGNRLNKLMGLKLPSPYFKRIKYAWAKFASEEKGVQQGPELREAIEEALWRKEHLKLTGMGKLNAELICLAPSKKTDKYSLTPVDEQGKCIDRIKYYTPNSYLGDKKGPQFKKMVVWAYESTKVQFPEVVKKSRQGNYYIHLEKASFAKLVEFMGLYASFAPEAEQEASMDILENLIGKYKRVHHVDIPRPIFYSKDFILQNKGESWEQAICRIVRGHSGIILQPQSLTEWGPKKGRSLGIYSKESERNR